MDSAISLKEDATLDDALAAAGHARRARNRQLGLPDGIDPQKVADQGQRIYDARYRAELEPRHHGQFVAIDVESGTAHIGATPEEAYLRGLRASLTAVLFLVRVGFETAFDFTPGGRDAGRKWLS
jgi:hypothetical protein